MRQEAVSARAMVDDVDSSVIIVFEPLMTSSRPCLASHLGIRLKMANFSGLKTRLIVFWCQVSKCSHNILYNFILNKELSAVSNFFLIPLCYCKWAWDLAAPGFWHLDTLLQQKMVLASFGKWHVPCGVQESASKWPCHPEIPFLMDLSVSYVSPSHLDAQVFLSCWTVGCFSWVPGQLDTRVTSVSSRQMNFWESHGRGVVTVGVTVFLSPPTAKHPRVLLDPQGDECPFCLPDEFLSVFQDFLGR